MAASMGGPSWQAPDDGATLKLVRNLDFCIFYFNYLYNLGVSHKVVGPVGSVTIILYIICISSLG